jgi:hypothetical protein
MKKILIVLGIFLCACAPSQDPEEYPTSDRVAEYRSGSVERFYDPESQVVCWVYTAPYRGGISCMPLSMTTYRP